MPAQNDPSYLNATPADGDYVTGVDISDTTQSASGSTASFLFSAIATYVKNVLTGLANTWALDQTFSQGISALYASFGAEANAESSGYTKIVDVQDTVTTLDSPGAFAAGMNVKATYNFTSGSPGSGNGYGLFFYALSDAASAAKLVVLLGIGGFADFSSDYSIDYVAGVAATADTNSPTGTVTNLIGVESNMYIGAAGNVTNGWLFRGRAPQTFSTGKYGTLYGLHIEDLTGATADARYAIKTDGTAPTSLGGDLTIGATKTANTVWAGPTTGSAAAPTWRALVAADIPDLTATYATDEEAIAYAMIFG